MKKLIFTILLAAVLWTVMFSPWTAPFVNFWWMMTGSALTLSVFATLFNPGWWREVKWSLPNVLLGIGIAVADRAGGRDFLARLCATHAFQTLESECGFCGGYFDLCTGACRFL